MKGFLESVGFMSSTKGLQSVKGFLHLAKGFQQGSNTPQLPVGRMTEEDSAQYLTEEDTTKQIISED